MHSDRSVGIGKPVRCQPWDHELTMFGDLGKVRERAKCLEKVDPKYYPFAYKIREFAGHFEDEPILAMEQYMEENNEQNNI